MTAGGGTQGAAGRLGLPASGPGSPAGWGRRFVALLLDWALANGAAVAIAGTAVWDREQGMIWLPLACWFVLVWLATALTGASLGQWIMRLRVIRLDRRPVGLWIGFIRTALIAMVIPPLIFTPERRGLHDLAAGTVCVNGPR